MQLLIYSSRLILFRFLYCRRWWWSKADCCWRSSRTLPASGSSSDAWHSGTFRCAWCRTWTSLIAHYQWNLTFLYFTPMFGFCSAFLGLIQVPKIEHLGTISRSKHIYSAPFVVSESELQQILTSQMPFLSSNQHQLYQLLSDKIFLCVR